MVWGGITLNSPSHVTVGQTHAEEGNATVPSSEV